MHSRRLRNVSKYVRPVLLKFPYSLRGKCFGFTFSLIINNCLKAPIIFQIHIRKVHILIYNGLECARYSSLKVVYKNRISHDRQLSTRYIWPAVEWEQIISLFGIKDENDWSMMVAFFFFESQFICAWKKDTNMSILKQIYRKLLASVIVKL